MRDLLIGGGIGLVIGFVGTLVYYTKIKAKASALSSQVQADVKKM